MNSTRSDLEIQELWGQLELLDKVERAGEIEANHLLGERLARRQFETRRPMVRPVLRPVFAAAVVAGIAAVALVSTWQHGDSSRLAVGPSDSELEAFFDESVGDLSVEQLKFFELLRDEV